MEIVVLICVLLFGVFLGRVMAAKQIWQRRQGSKAVKLLLQSGISVERRLDGGLRITVASDGKQTHHVFPPEDARSWAQDILDMLSEETT